MKSTEQTGAFDDRPEGATESTLTAGQSWVHRYVARRFVNQMAVVRLRAELATAHPEFDLLVERADAEGELWVDVGRALLTGAEEALRRGSVESAWRHLHTARRMEVYGLERLDATNESGSRSEVEIRAASVREEALDTLDGWRRRVVIDLLCDPSDETTLKEGITGSELRRASRVLDEHYENIHLLRSERQRQFNALVVMGAVAGLTLFALSLVDWTLGPVTGEQGGFLATVARFVETPFGPSVAVDVTAPGFAVFMTVVGVMGASLFGMRSLRIRPLPTKIPQQVSQLTVTSARAVIGAISALLFYFALQTPLLDGGILASSVSTAPTTMIVVAFAAGYTERMAPDVVAKVSAISATDDADSTDDSGTN